VEIARRRCTGGKDQCPLYYNFGDKGACPAVHFLEAARSVRKYVVAGLPKPKINDSTLVLHMRGEDIFPRRKYRYFFPHTPDSWYGQPTCSFYLDVMERDKGHDKVQIIAPDSLNYCLKPCIRKGAIFKKQSLSMDFATMLWAKRLVLSRSTLMRAVMYLSPVEKTWYVFGRMETRDVGMDFLNGQLWPILGGYEYCVPSIEYEENVLFKWDTTKYERVLTDTCTWTRYSPDAG
jgi:hypothetical protein